MNKQSAHLLEQHLDTAFSAPNGIKKLRELILTLAMQGKLVAQDPNEPLASELLKDIEADKKQWVKDGKLKKLKPPSRIAKDELPFTLPESWRWVRIEDIAGAIDYGTSQKTSDDSSLVPVYRMGNIVDGRLIDDGFKYLPPDTSIDDLPKLNGQGRIVAKLDELMQLCDTLEQRIAARTAKQTELLHVVMAQM